MSARALCLASLALLASCEACDPTSVSELALGLSARPGQLVLRGFVDAPLEAEVILTATGGAHVVLEGAALEDASGPAAVELALDGDAIAPGGERTLAVHIAPEGELGLVRGLIRVRSDAGELEIPLTAEIHPVPDCDDDNPCTEDRFDRAQRVCVNEAAPDQTPCDDGSACTEGDLCAAGRCVGAPLVCEDGVECTVDACDPEVGCVFVPRHSACSDGDPCTDDVCGAGGCENPASPPGTVCLLNGCESMGFCAAGSCVETAVPDGAPCEDGDVCTAGDTCQAGVCEAGAPAEIGAARPRGIVTGEVVGDPCGFALDELFGCLQTWEAGPREILASRVEGEAIEFAWRGRYLDEAGVPCRPDDPLYLSRRAIDPPEEDEAPGAARPLAPPYCAASVFRSRADLQGITTAQVSALRGRGAAAFAGSTLHLAHVDAERLGVWYERTDALGTRLVERLPLDELAPLGQVALAVRGGDAALLVAPLQRTDDPARLLEEGDEHVVPLRLLRLTPGGDAPPAVARVEVPERFAAACSFDTLTSAPRPLEAELQLQLEDDGRARALVLARYDGCGDMLGAQVDPLTGARPPRRAFHGLVDASLPDAQRLTLLADDEGVEVARAELDGERLTLVRRAFTCVDECLDGVADVCGLICGVSESVRVQPLDDDGPPLELGGVSLAPQPFAFDGMGDDPSLTRVGLVGDGDTTELRWHEAGLVEQRVSEVAPLLLDASRPFRRAAGAPVAVGVGDTEFQPVAAVAAFGCLLDTGVDLEPCQTDLDCAAGEVCNTTDVCLPPPDCAEGACEPVCYGACEAP